MSNYNKSFNFRNGIQVDVDDLIVRGNLVGIGTTIPRSDLDVHGRVQVTGIVTTSNLFVTGISTFNDEIHIGTGITISPQLGIISATFRGDASQLDNLPTSQWVDVDPGVGYTSIYNNGPVGVGTTNPLHTLQIGGSPDNPVHFGVGIDSTRGNIKTTGIVTAASFVGSGAGITAINASNINDGTLDSARLPAIFSSLTEVESTNLSVTGVGTVATIDSTSGTIDTLGSNNITSTNLNVSGISTLGVTSFTGGVTFGSDLLFGDNITLRIGDAVNGDLRLYHNGTDSYIQDSGDGNLILRGDDAIILEQTDGSEKYAQFNKNGSVELYNNGTKRFETLGYGATVTGDLKVSNNATVIGIITAHGADITNATVGVATITNVLDAAEITVVKYTATGVSTFSGAIDANAGATIDNVQIGISDDNEIDTSTGSLTIDSSSGQTIVDDNLSVTGIATVTGDLTAESDILPSTDLGSALGSTSKYFSEAYIDQINIGVAGTNTISTRNGTTLILDSDQGTVVVDADLSVTGVSTFTDVELVNDIRPDTDLGSSLGSINNYFSAARVNQVNIGVAGTNTISTRNGTTLILDSDQGTVVVDADLSVTGVSTFTNAELLNDIRPSTDQGASLGTASVRFSDLYVDNIRIGVGSDQEIIANTGNLEIKAPSGNVNISNFNPIGVVTFSSDVLPNADKTIDLGSTTEAYAQLHVDEVRIGVTPNTIDTRSGDLILDATTNNVNVSANLSVTDTLEVDQDVFVGTGATGFAILGTNQNIGIGTSAPTTSIQVVKYGNNEVNLVSENASSTIRMSSALGSNDDTATISYNGTDLSISNADVTGNINVNLGSGTGINTTSDFVVSNAGENRLVVSHEGFIGINKTSPTKELDVVGSIEVSQDANIVGVLTVGTGINQVTFGSGSSVLNVDINSTGLSTITTLDATRITSNNLKVEVGIATFFAGSTIGTDTYPSDVDLSNHIFTIDGSASISNGIMLYDDDSIIGIGTTVIPSDNRTGYGNLRAIDYGKAHVRGTFCVLGATDGQALFIPGVHDDSSNVVKYKNTQSIDNHFYQFAVGVNTHVARSCMDLGGSSSPLILPSINATGLSNLINSPNDSTIDDPVLPAGSGHQVLGALYYDSVDSCARLGISTNNSANSFVRLFHASTSGAIESFAVPQASAANVSTLGSDSNIPEGAIVYNTASDDIQVKRAGGFGSIGFVKAFGRVNSGTLQAGSYNAAYTNPSGTIARITFSTALSSANYTIVYSHANSNGTWSNVTNTITSQTTTEFEITWGTLSGLDWYFAVLQV